jgi:hypothetical protein
VSARVLKWTVPVDDRPHNIGTGRIAHVACQHGPDAVQVWTVEGPEASPVRPVQVFGTGHLVPAYWHHVGSAVTAGGQLVWHVFEAPPEQWGRGDES